jgi:hypothetical protein
LKEGLRGERRPKVRVVTCHPYYYNNHIWKTKLFFKYCFLTRHIRQAWICLCQRLSLNLHLTQCYCLMFVPLPHFLKKLPVLLIILIFSSSTQGWLTKYVVRNMLLVLGIWHVKWWTKRIQKSWYQGWSQGWAFNKTKCLSSSDHRMNYECDVIGLFTRTDININKVSESMYAKHLEKFLKCILRAPYIHEHPS